VSPWWRPTSQLDRIAWHVAQIETTLDRMEKKMSTQESDLNNALADYFSTVSAGLDRIEAKLAEAGTPVDLTDEIAAIKDAEAAFTARVDVDVPPTP
jgi:hypothetical protein